MKICILTHTFPKYKDDHTAPFLHAFATGLVRNGHEVIVLAPYFKGFKKDNFPYRVIRYKYIWPDFLHILGYSVTLKKGKNLPISAYLVVPFLIFFGTIKLIWVCRKEKINVVSSHWLLPNGLIAYLASRLTNTPYTITLPGSDVFVTGMNVIFKKIARMSVTESLAVIADSPLFMDKLRSFGIRPKTTEIIPYPVDVDVYKPNKTGPFLRKKLGYNSKNIIVLAVGRLVEKKGFTYLLKSMEMVIKKSSNVRLVIIGDGDLKEEFIKFIKKINLQRYIMLAGSIDRKNILSYYNMADIFVMPSIMDDKGNVDDQPVALLEAMACGLPVVATNFAGIALSVRDRKNGFLVPQKDISAITSAILALVESSNLRKAMGKNSRKIIGTRLSISEIGKRYVQLIKSALKNNEKRRS